MNLSDPGALSTLEAVGGFLHTALLYLHKKSKAAKKRDSALARYSYPIRLLSTAVVVFWIVVFVFALPARISQSGDPEAFKITLMCAAVLLCIIWSGFMLFRILKESRPCLTTMEDIMKRSASRPEIQVSAGD